MRFFYISLLSMSLALAQHPHEASAGPAQLLPGLGNHHHSMATSSGEAQQYFDQGFRLIYAFNHEEAAKSFARAAELDPQAPMPWWGIALALGPNINLDVDPEREKAAYEAIQKAVALAANAPETERDYIRALAARYSIDPNADLKKLAADYAGRMGALSKKYPDDLDAATLYAESLMDLRPWQLWTADRQPVEGTLEIVAVLESVLRRDPNHVGANHYYIHAVEASATPERALPSAARLGGLAPGAGHLVHMPAHIHIQLGEYDAAVRSNEAAAEADRSYMQASGNESGVYPLMYYNHNIHFLAVSNTLRGRYEPARKSAAELAANVGPALTDMPMLQPYAAWQWFVPLRFSRWDEILTSPQPAGSLPVLRSMWHFARAIALIGKGRVEDARQEELPFIERVAEVPADAPWDVLQAAGVLRVAAWELKARIAEASGDRTGAIDFWRKAVAVQDQAGYAEPPAWYYSTRESLGGALLRAGQAAEAEAVFREDLEKNARSPRSLFGLLEALKAQNKPGTEWVESQFREAWKNADFTLTVGAL
jgi:hypothetical protein